jgi:tetratricopeptide (TPR) repeat protein
MMIHGTTIANGQAALTVARAALAEDRPHDAVAGLRSGIRLCVGPVGRTSLRVLLDEALLQAGEYDEADAFWAFEDKGPKADPSALERFVLGACAAGSFSRALSRLDEIADLLPAQRRWIIRYRCLVGMGEAEKAYAHIDAARGDLSAHVALRYRVNVLLSEHRYPEVLDRLSQASDIRSADLLRLQTRAFIDTGEHAHVEVELAMFRDYFPDEEWIDLELARNATVARWSDLALQRWRDLHRNRPEQLAVVQGLFEVLLDKGDFAAVVPLLDTAQEHHPRVKIDSLRARALIVEGDLPGAEAILQETIDNLTGQASCATLATLWSELAQIHHLTAERSLQPAPREADLACARRAHALLPDSITLKCKLADALIRSGATAEAKATINALPASNKDIVLRLRMWRHAMDEDHDAARALWKTRKLIHYIPLVHAGRFANLHRMDENSLPPGDALALYTCIRDERDRLPWFFDYYRRLGVEHFVVIDNGSTDSSTEYLLSQSGTTVFRTDDSYHGAFAGMVWINHLKSRLSPAAWVLYADVDEALVYEGCERRSVADLAETLDMAGQEAFTAFMLDMFSTDASGGTGKGPNVDYVTRYPLYLPQIQVTPKPLCPYIHIRGGLRALFATGEELTKTPLVKSGADIDFLQSSHSVTPARVSDMTGVLLHYKIIDGIAEEAARVLQDQTRSAHCNARYAKYRDAPDLPELIGAAMADVRTYGASDDLVAAGLMTPIRWGAPHV